MASQTSIFFAMELRVHTIGVDAKLERSTWNICLNFCRVLASYTFYVHA
jgi:hypothetical protein